MKQLFLFMALVMSMAITSQAQPTAVASDILKAYKNAGKPFGKPLLFEGKIQLRSMGSDELLVFVNYERDKKHNEVYKMKIKDIGREAIIYTIDNGQAVYMDGLLVLMHKTLPISMAYGVGEKINQTNTFLPYEAMSKVEVFGLERMTPGYSVAPVDLSY